VEEVSNRSLAQAKIYKLVIHVYTEIGAKGFGVGVLDENTSFLTKDNPESKAVIFDALGIPVLAYYLMMAELVNALIT
jgi:hypothetical protein